MSANPAASVKARHNEVMAIALTPQPAAAIVWRACMPSVLLWAPTTNLA
jgi:hypothetical protein